MRKLLPAILFGVLIIPAFLVNSCANTTQAPTGGDKDTIPPALIWADPMPGATNVAVSGAKFYFGFDEYVKVKEAKNILLSPPLKKAPKTKIKSRGFEVYFEEELKPNTTYTISFTGAVADNNEGNMFPGYSYPFSTGETIDSMFICGTVLNSSDLKPVKGASVLLYKDHSDSAVFKTRPDAIAKTDDWGYFSISYIQDTLYRLYAIDDQNNNYIYDPETEKIAFIDSLIRPKNVFCDTLPELRQYDMKDTLGIAERTPEYTLNLFKENPSRQLIKNTVRVNERTAYITFMAQDAWIDSLFIVGYPASKVITQFNLQQDSLEIWVNDRAFVPDTLHMYVNYRKTDSLGLKTPFLEHVPLFVEGKAASRPGMPKPKANIKKEDTTCVFKLEAAPELFEKKGFELTFSLPIISENFDSLKLNVVNPKQKSTPGKFKVEQDTLNIRHYTVRPEGQILPGYEYKLKVPAKAFRDINGSYSDSTEVKVMLPTDEKLSSLTLNLTGVECKMIVDLLPLNGTTVLRSEIVNSNTTVVFQYLKEDKYRVRFTQDVNDNSMIDTGCLLEHRQPEKVRFYELEKGKNAIEVPASSEITQDIDVQQIMKD